MNQVIDMRRNFHLSKSILITFVILLINSLLFGQIQINASLKRGALEATLPLVTMPSPNSAVLTRTISENVDYYTGRLSVDVPLYTLKSNSIELPISLQTTADAHKVDDIGSWVGLGFRLNAGGVVTRVMKNLPDEADIAQVSPQINIRGIGFLNLNTAEHGFVDLKRFQPSSPQPYTNSQKVQIINYGTWNRTTDAPFIGYDLQPDEFFFSFGKYSGKFVFDQSGNIICITEGNFYITPTITAGKITAFSILTDDGFKYEFGNYALNAVEENKLEVKSKVLPLFYRYIGCERSAPLTISTTNQNPVQYPALSGQSFNAWRYLYESKPYVMTYENPASGPPNGQRASVQNMDFNYGPNQEETEYFTYPSSWYLTRITSPTGDFITLTYLNSGTLTYTSDRSTASCILPWGDADICHPQFPHNCYACDLNIYGALLVGNNSSHYEIPVEPKNSSPTIWNFKSYPTIGQISITTSITTVTAKRLKEINTNQGTKIEFIANTPRLDLTGDTRLDKISIKHNGLLLKEFEFDYSTTYNSAPFETHGTTASRIVFHFGANGNYTNITGEDVSFTDQGYLPEESVRYRMFLKEVTEIGSNNIALPPIKFEYTSENDLPFRTSFSQDKYGFKGQMGVDPTLTNLLAGVLRKITYPTGGSKEFTFQISGNANAWNGLKVSQVNEYEPIGGTQNIKTYTYGNFNYVDHALFGYDMPDAILSTTVNGQDRFIIVAIKRSWSFKRLNPAMQTRGAAGGYDWVRVMNNDGGSYKIEFSANSDVDVPVFLVSTWANGFPQQMGSSWDFPFPQRISEDWKRGLPKVEYFLGSDGKKIKSIHYDYDLTSSATGQGFTVGIQPTKYRIIRPQYLDDWNWMLYGQYTQNPKWQLMTKKEERIYNSDESAFLQKTLENSYNKITYLGKELVFLRETKMTSDSKKEQSIQKIKYPLDYSTTTDAFGNGITQLKSKNVLQAPIEQFQWVQDQQGNNKRYVGGLLNQYHSDKPLIRQILGLQTAAPLASLSESAIVGNSFTYDPKYKPTILFNSYDNAGNILEQSKVNDVKESFIWDYNSLYPIAKIINAQSGSIAYTSFEADGWGGWTMGTGSTIDVTKSITGRKSFSGSLSKSVPTGNYVVTLWSINNFFVTVNGATGTPLVTKGQYTLYKWALNNISNVQVSGGNIDEVRLYPAVAQMTTFTYDPLVGMTSQCDINNRITYYQYDEFGRLVLVRDDNQHIIKKICYNYSGQPENCSVYNCSIYNCSGVDKRCVNGNCETGVKTLFLSEYEADTGYWTCTYRYVWSDGIQSDPFFEVHTNQCTN